MRRFRDRLEGGYRVVRIRRLKHYLWALFAVLILVVGILMMMLNGLSLDPFFLPLDIFLLVALYLLMILSGANFFFRNLEIRHNTRDSQKYLMAKNSQRTGAVIVVICVFAALIVALPFVATSANQILSSEGEGSLTSYRESFVRNFENQDRLGLFKSEWMEVGMTSGRVVLQLCQKTDYQQDDVCDDPLFERTMDPDSVARVSVPEEGYEQLAIVIVNGPSGPSSFSYHIERNPAPIFIGLQPLLICAILILLNAVWITYLQPVRKKYAKSSVYSEDYVVSIGAETGPATRASSVPKATTVATIPRPTKRVPAPKPAPDAEGLPPPPLPGIAHPLPRGAFLNELMTLPDIEGNKQQAIRFLRTLIELDPMNKDALLLLGDAYKAEGDHSFAFNEYDRIIRIDHKDDEAWVRRGEVLLTLERNLEAVESFREALEINPENTSATEWLHNIRLENQRLMAKAIDRSTNKDFGGAIELYDKILARDPDNLQALLGKGTMYRRLEKWPASLESLNRALELDPDNIAAVRNKIEVFESVMSWEEALTCYDEIIDKSPDNYLDWIRRGDVLLELARNEEAMESYKKAEVLKPDSDRVQKRIRMLTTPAMDETVKEFAKLPGIGTSKAITLFEAGFQSVEDLEKASIKKLAKVKGISKGTAKKIKKHLKG